MISNKNDIMEKAAEIRDLLKNNDIKLSEASQSLKELKSDAYIFFKDNNIPGKYSDIKSLLVIYNTANFSDLTLIIHSSIDEFKITDYAGDDNLFKNISSLINQDINFFRNLEKTDVSGKLYRILHESMNTAAGQYSIVTLSESQFMKPSSFHILCDIVMDLIKIYQYSPQPIHYDFFESLSVDINSYLTKTGSFKSFNAYVFSFSNFARFFKNIPFSLITELSSDVEKKLISLFGYDTGVFRISLSMFLVIAENESGADSVYEEIRDGKMDFILRGIVLPYTSTRLTCDSETSSYTVLQKIMTSDKFRNY
jgi:hypothetical protein